MRSLASAVTITLGAYRYRKARDAAHRTWRDIGKGDRARDTREFSEEIQVAEMSPLLRLAARSRPEQPRSKTIGLSCHLNCYRTSS
jgi:hypothetical protein